MNNILKLMVQELMKEGLSVEELKSLTTEISKNADLVNCLLDNSKSVIDFPSLTT